MSRFPNKQIWNQKRNSVTGHSSVSGRYTPFKCLCLLIYKAERYQLPSDGVAGRRKDINVCEVLRLEPARNRCSKNVCFDSRYKTWVQTRVQDASLPFTTLSPWLNLLKHFVCSSIKRGHSTCTYCRITWEKETHKRYPLCLKGVPGASIRITMLRMDVLVGGGGSIWAVL